MLKKHLLTVHTEPPVPAANTSQNSGFTHNLEASLLLALLKQNRLTQRQYECCLTALQGE